MLNNIKKKKENYKAYKVYKHKYRLNKYKIAASRPYQKIMRMLLFLNN